MLRVALTGGIGSGKSTVAGLFAACDVPVLDADELARRLTEPGQAAYSEIVAHFGTAILDGERRIDRKQLRRRIFDDPDERRRLEAILHPRIRLAMEEEISGLNSPYCLLVIPLLLEARERFPVDQVLVVDADEKLQIERATQRDASNAEHIKQIIAAQLPRAERLRHAQDVITNNGGLKELEEAVERFHRLYLNLARNQTTQNP